MISIQKRLKITNFWRYLKCWGVRTDPQGSLRVKKHYFLYFFRAKHLNMAKTKSERNKEARLRRIEKHGIEWERQRTARTYIPVDQLSTQELKARRKRKADAMKRLRAKQKQENPTQVYNVM